MRKFPIVGLGTYLDLVRWVFRGFSMPAPWLIKMKVLSRYRISDAPWVETGTYMGQTTMWLARISPEVVSLEPSQDLFRKVQQRLGKWSNIRLLNETSESGLEQAISSLRSYRQVCFWLDGHFSASGTFMGHVDTPVLFELETISAAWRSGVLEDFVVFVDDVRLFQAEHREIPSDSERPGYPSLSALVNWAQELNCDWFIEKDIMVMSKRP